MAILLQMIWFLLLANGEAGNEPLSSTHPEWSVFVELLKQTSETLAKKIAKDGEGATKLIEVNVHGMETKAEAQMMGKTIVGSNLSENSSIRCRCELGQNYCCDGS